MYICNNFQFLAYYVYTESALQYNLKVREIKGLLTTKILQAQEKNIRISIEVPEPIDKIDMPIVNLSRAIGII